MRRRDLIIVDNFLDNPDGVREYALEQQFERLGGKNWPGRDSVKTHGEKEMTAACSEVVGQQLITKSVNKCSYFRITKEGQHGSQHIHFDPNPGLIWAGVLYLTPTFHPTAGTKFWKHKETGWERAPTMEEGAKYGIKSYEDMLNFFNTEGKDESKWICTTYDDCRLVQLFFFHGA